MHRPISLLQATISIGLVMLGVGCGIAARHIALNHPKVKGMLDAPPPPLTRPVESAGYVETIGDGDDRITVLYLSGTPYEMGFEHGRLLKDQVAATIADVQVGLLKFVPSAIQKTWLLSLREKQAIINDMLDRAWAKMEPFTPPEDLEELRGLADGSGIPLRTLTRMHALPDFGETSCSGMVARGGATRDGHVYQLRILDYGAQFNLQRRPMIIVYRPTNGQPYVNITWTGFIGVVSGVNEAGVGLSEMGFGDPPDEHLAGMPMPFMLKNVLRYARTAEEAAAIIRATPRTNSYVYFVGDRRGGAVGLITNAQQTQIHRPGESETLEVGRDVLPQYSDVVYGGHFGEKQATLTSELHGKFDVPILQNLAQQIAMKSNLHTVIYDLTGETIWVANREGKIRAADRPYVAFALRPAWTRNLADSHRAAATHSTAE